MNRKRLWTSGIFIAAVSAAFISGCKVESKTESIEWTKSSSEAALDGQNGQDEQGPQGGNDPAAIPGASSGGNSSTGADAPTIRDTGTGETSSPLPTDALSNPDYILPDSGTAYLSESDLAQLTPDQFRLARNEIYARHGRKFNAQDLQAYFDSKSWYQGTVDASAFNEGVLNECEKANIRLLQSMEPTAGLTGLGTAPSKEVIDRYGYSSGYSNLSFDLIQGTAKDCGNYYQVEATYMQGIEAPGNLAPGETITLVFNELTGETRTLVYGDGGLYNADATSYGYPDYYYSPSEDGSPVTLYQDSDDRVDKPVYNGSLYIRKDATVEVAIDNQSEPVTLSTLQKDFNWYNGVYFDQKGYVTRLVFYGD